MPWETDTVMKQREHFVEAAQRHEKSFSALCRDYGITRSAERLDTNGSTGPVRDNAFVIKAVVRTVSLPKQPGKWSS